MRTDKELIQILLENINLISDVKGLCFLITALLYKDIISINESKRLNEIINKYIVNKNTIKVFFVDKRRVKSSQMYYSDYFFPPREIEPRKKYLEYLLEVL